MFPVLCDDNDGVGMRVWSVRDCVHLAWVPGSLGDPHGVSSHSPEGVRPRWTRAVHCSSRSSTIHRMYIKLKKLLYIGSKSMLYMTLFGLNYIIYNDCFL